MKRIATREQLERALDAIMARGEIALAATAGLARTRRRVVRERVRSDGTDERGTDKHKQCGLHHDVIAHRKVV